MARRPTRRSGFPSARARARGTVVAAGILPGLPGATPTPSPSPSPAPTPTPPPGSSGDEARIGANYGGPNYYAPFVPENNFGPYIAVGDDGNAFTPYAGITSHDPAGDLWQTNTGVTFLNGGHATHQVLSSDPATGQHVIRITGDATDTNQRILRWSGTKPTSIVVTRRGVTGEIAPEWIAGVEGDLRDLDMGFANACPLTGQQPENLPTDPVYRYGASFGAFLPMLVKCKAIAAKMAADDQLKNYWCVLPVDRDDAQIRAYATIQCGILPPTARIKLEFGNEKFWNLDFSSNVRMLLEGIRGGWYGNATVGNPNPGIDPVIIAGGGLQYEGNAASPATAAGGRVFASLNGVGRVVLKAMQNVPAGAEVWDNAYWDIEFDENAMKLAARRWDVVRSKAIIEIYKDVFGSRYASQIEFMVMGQEVVSDLSAEQSVTRTFDPAFWADVGGMGYAFYANNGEGLDYANATPASIEAGFRANGIPAMKSYVMRAIADAASHGKKARFYEGGTHPDGQYHDRIDDVTFRYPKYHQGWIDLFNSDAGAAIVRDIVIFMRSYLPADALAMFYSMTSDNQRLFSLRTAWTDTNNKRYLGFKAGMAAALPGPAASGYRFWRFTPTGGSRQGLTADNGFFRTGWAGLTLKADAATIAPTSSWLIYSPSSSGGNSPARLIDNNDATEFLTEQGAFDRTGVVILDVGRGQSIDVTSVLIREAANAGFTPIGMKIERSVDGVTWEVAANVAALNFVSGTATVALAAGTGAPAQQPPPPAANTRKVKNILIRVDEIAEKDARIYSVRGTELLLRDANGARIAGLALTGPNYDHPSYGGDNNYDASQVSANLADNDRLTAYTSFPIYAGGPVYLRGSYSASVDAATLSWVPLTASNSPGKWKVWVSEGAIGDDGTGGTLVIDRNEADASGWQNGEERAFSLI